MARMVEKILSCNSLWRHDLQDTPLFASQKSPVLRLSLLNSPRIAACAWYVCRADLKEPKAGFVAGEGGSHDARERLD